MILDNETIVLMQDEDNRSNFILNTFLYDFYKIGSIVIVTRKQSFFKKIITIIKRKLVVNESNIVYLKKVSDMQYFGDEIIEIEHKDFGTVISLVKSEWWRMRRGNLCI